MPMMEFKKKEIAKPYEVTNTVGSFTMNTVESGQFSTTISNGIRSIYTRAKDGGVDARFIAFKVKFNMSTDFKKYHDIYIDVKLTKSDRATGLYRDVYNNMFVGFNCLNGNINLSDNTIAWYSTKDSEGYYPELSSLGRASRFYNYSAVNNAIDPLDYTTRLTDQMIQELMDNNGEVWLFIMSGLFDVISNRKADFTSSIPGVPYPITLATAVGQTTTIEVSPLYTYPNFEGSIEENSNVIYKNPSIIRDIKHNLPAIADDSEINRRIVATYPTMMYLYDTAGDMSELNTTIIQNCADENRETAQRLYETTMYEYNPIENYSMTEDGNHTLDGSSNTTNANNTITNYENCEGHKEKGNNRIDSSSEGSNNANGKSDSEATKQQFGYNSKNPTDVEKSISKADTDNNSKTLTRDGSVGSSNNESRTHGKSETKNQTNGTENRTNNESGITHLTRKGNIGVTTTQQMIQQEREVILDVLDWYVAKFIKCFKWGVI